MEQSYHNKIRSKIQVYFKYDVKQWLISKNFKSAWGSAVAVVKSYQIGILWQYCQTMYRQTFAKKAIHFVS